MKKLTALQKMMTAIAAVAAIGVVVWGVGRTLDRQGLSEREQAQITQLVKDQLAAGTKTSSGSSQQSMPAGTFSSAQKTELERIFKEQMLSNPAVLRQALLALEQFQQAEQQQKGKTAIIENASSIFRSKYSHVTGNPKGKVTMVEFFDYNCGFCKRSLNDVLKLLETDPDLRLVLKEFPILGAGSVYAARAAVASRKQGKYWEFHLALMKARGLNQAKVDRIAVDIGLDLAKLKTDMDAPEVKATIAESHDLADKLGIRGTPAFIIADQLIPGALGYDALQKQIASIRDNGGCKIC